MIFGVPSGRPVRLAGRTTVKRMRYYSSSDAERKFTEMMKKITALIMAAVLTALTCVSAGAAKYKYEYEYPLQFPVYYNGTEIHFVSNSGNYTPAQLIDGKTMVPMRKIFETYGAKVEWIESRRMVIATKGSLIMAVTIDSPDIYVTDVLTQKTTKLTSRVPAVIVNDKTLVPVRAISEGLGLDVEWVDDETGRAVYIKG